MALCPCPSCKKNVTQIKSQSMAVSHDGISHGSKAKEVFSVHVSSLRYDPECRIQVIYNGAILGKLPLNTLAPIS